MLVGHGASSTGSSILGLVGKLPKQVNASLCCLVKMVRQRHRCCDLSNTLAIVLPKMGAGELSRGMLHLTEIEEVIRLWKHDVGLLAEILAAFQNHLAIVEASSSGETTYGALTMTFLI